MKKLFSLVLAVVVSLGCFTIVPIFASAVSDGDLGTGVYWSYDSETKTLYLSGEGEIPVYDTMPSIPWWNYSDEIKNVLIGEGITSIASLKKLSQIKEISLPDSATEIEGSAFYSCYSLETVNLSKHTAYVSNRAFDGCESLKNFTINGDINGKSSPFTDSAGNITGDGYFVRDGVLFANYSTYVDNNLCIKKINHNTLVKYPSGRETINYTIPSSTMEIYSDAFSSVKNLQTITIPSSVVSLYVRSFVGYGESFEKPLTLVFQHDTYPTDASYSAIRNLVAGSKIIVKNEEVKKAFIEKLSSFIYNSGGAQNVTIVAEPKRTTNLNITSAPKSLIVGETGVIEAVQTPYNTTDNITFTSSDESIVSFDKYICGQITAHKPGTVTIAVTSGSVTKKYTITVTCTHSSTHIINTASPSCSKTGYTGDVACTKCGTVITKGTSVPKLEHSYGNWVNELEATCTEFGVSYRKCNACGKIDYKYVEELGHTFSSEWTVDKQPTCISEGSKSNHCIHCSEKTNVTAIPSTGHNYTDWVVEIEVSVNQFGIETRRCTSCREVNYKYIEYIDGEFHYMVLDSKNNVIENGTYSETEHCSSDWIIDKAASCTEQGVKHKECVFCGAVLAEETTPASGHLSTKWIIDDVATVSAPGSKHKECTVCKEVLERATIAQLKPATPKTTTTNEINGINITWNAVAGATRYNVYRRQAGQTAWTLVGTTTGTIITDTKVTSGVYYCYSVRAYNNAGQYSDFINANTNTRKYMAVPKLTGISNATNGLYFTWNTVPGVTNGYRVYRRGAGATYWTYLGTVKTTCYTDSQVENKSGEYYRYTVIADGGYQSKFDTDGLYLKRLANPTPKSAVSSKAGITVKWSAVAGTTGYYVYRKTANSTWVRIAAVGGTNNTSFVDQTAQKGVTYTYTVRACYGYTLSSYNAAGVSCRDLY